MISLRPYSISYAGQVARTACPKISSWRHCNSRGSPSAQPDNESSSARAACRTARSGSAIRPSTASSTSGQSAHCDGWGQRFRSAPDRDTARRTRSARRPRLALVRLRTPGVEEVVVIGSSCSCAGSNRVCMLCRSYVYGLLDLCAEDLLAATIERDDRIVVHLEFLAALRGLVDFWTLFDLVARDDLIGPSIEL